MASSTIHGIQKVSRKGRLFGIVSMASAALMVIQLVAPVYAIAADVTTDTVSHCVAAEVDSISASSCPTDSGLKLTKTAVNNDDGTVTYTIHWVASGTGTFTDVKITDPLPDGSGFESADLGASLDFGIVSWTLGDIVAPATGDVHLTIGPSYHDWFADKVLDYQPGVSADGTIRVLDATANSPVLPNLEGAVFPVTALEDLQYQDGQFIETPFNGDFGAGLETKTVDDEGRTFVALGDGGQITVDATTLKNVPGDDFVLFETPGDKDPACVSVVATDNTVYPTAPSAACGGKNAFKFQDVGMADSDGIAINLDSLGLANGVGIKSITVYDILDGLVLGTTGSAGYDLDYLGLRTDLPCEVSNTATITAKLDGKKVTDSSTVSIVSHEGACVPELTLDKTGDYDSGSGEITYTITYHLDGAGTAHNVKIVDALPADTGFVSASDGGVEAAGTVTWNLGDLVAPATGSVTLVLSIGSNLPFDSVLDFQPGVSAAGTIRVLDATTNSPVLPNLEGAAFPVLNVQDLKAHDAAFVETPFNGDFGSGLETKTVDDAARTFIALGDGGKITVGPSNPSGYIANDAGNDITIFETPNAAGKDPACISVTATDDTVYPTAANPACGGAAAYKFQATGDAPSSGMALNFDAMGVPAGKVIKAVTIYDILDGVLLGTTGSPGYDLDFISGNAPATCAIENTATVSATAMGKDLTAEATAKNSINDNACTSDVTLEKTGVIDHDSGHITYTITYHITTGVAHNVVIKDNLPPSTSFVSASDSGTFDNTVPPGVVTWNLGDLAGPATGSVTLVVDTMGSAFYDDVLNYVPGVSAAGEIRVLDASLNSPVLPNLEGAAFPIPYLKDLEAHDGLFVNTDVTADFGSGSETKTVDDEARTFVALGDGGKITVGPSDGSSYIMNRSGDDLVLFETAGGKDPACISVTALDNTVYPTAANPACDGAAAYKFQGTGDAFDSGISLNLDVLGVPAGARIKSITINDILDGELLGTTGSAGYDLDAINGFSMRCDYVNHASIAFTGHDAVTATNTLHDTGCDNGGGTGCITNCGGTGGNLGSITGVVFNDLNNNGAKDEGDPQLSGWTVYLDTNDNGTLDPGEPTKVTASPYLFSNLADGTYNVREVLQSGWTQTLPAANGKYVVVISGANHATDKDFGNFQTQGGSGGGCVTNCGGGGGIGGCLVNCISGGTPGGTGTTNPAPTVPGSVLGDNTTAVGGNPTQVAGAATELPRTGADWYITLLSAAMALGLIWQFKRELELE